MAVKRVIDGVHLVPMGIANAFLIEGHDGLTLIDAGFPGRQATAFEAIRGLGRSLDQLKHLIFTHCHPDHIGSAGAIVRETGARTYMHPLDHPLDVPIAESGGAFRPMHGAPGLLRQVMCKMFFHPGERVEPVAIDQPLTAEEILPVAGGIEGHLCPRPLRGTGSVALACGTHVVCRRCMHEHHGPWDPVGFESLQEGRASQRKLASLSFDAVGFGHGAPDTIRTCDLLPSEQDNVPIRKMR
jgi:glyoxylase-like metal-dependent hydrolase (beta-lactamase superfamily II)